MTEKTIDELRSEIKGMSDNQLTEYLNGIPNVDQLKLVMDNYKLAYQIDYPCDMIMIEAIDQDTNSILRLRNRPRLPEHIIVHAIRKNWAAGIVIEKWTNTLVEELVGRIEPTHNFFLTLAKKCWEHGSDKHRLFMTMKWPDIKDRLRIV